MSSWACYVRDRFVRDNTFRDIDNMDQQLRGLGVGPADLCRTNSCTFDRMFDGGVTPAPLEHDPLRTSVASTYPSVSEEFDHWVGNPVYAIRDSSVPSPTISPFAIGCEFDRLLRHAESQALRGCDHPFLAGPPPSSPLVRGSRNSEDTSWESLPLANQASSVTSGAGGGFRWCGVRSNQTTLGRIGGLFGRHSTCLFRRCTTTAFLTGAALVLLAVCVLIVAGCLYQST